MTEVIISSAALTIHPDGSVRHRRLDGWSVLTTPGRIGERAIVVHELTGWTVREADGTEPPARFTNTSPIQSCEGNVVTTASGSTYELVDPRPSWATENGWSAPTEGPWLDDRFINDWLPYDGWRSV